MPEFYDKIQTAAGNHQVCAGRPRRRLVQHKESEKIHGMRITEVVHIATLESDDAGGRKQRLRGRHRKWSPCLLPPFL